MESMILSQPPGVRGVGHKSENSSEQSAGISADVVEVCACFQEVGDS